MTIRERLSRTKHRLSAVTIVFWIAFAVSGLGTIAIPYLAAFIPVAFLGFMGCVLMSLYGIRCPNCRGNLGYALSWPPSWGVSERIKFCPYCGIPMDTDVQDLRQGDPHTPS